MEYLRFRFAMNSLVASIIFGVTYIANAENPEFGIDSLTYSGDACPTNSIATYISSDRQVFTVTYDEFTVSSIGSTIPGQRIEAGTSCHLKLGIRVPVGWAMALPKVTVDGFVRLDLDARASQRVFYSLVGEYLPMAWQDFVGPIEKNYSFDSHVPPQRLAWSPCSDGLSLIQLELISMGLISTRGGAQGVLTVDTTDGEFVQHYQPRWVACGESPKLKANTISVYRAYQTQEGFHFFTTDVKEYDGLKRRSRWRGEGAMFRVFNRQADPGTLPVVRLKNPTTQRIYLSADGGEIRHLISLGWIRENIDFGYVFTREMPGLVPIYRLYNRSNGAHYFTVNQAEVRQLLGAPNTIWEQHAHLGYTVY
jgi:hypothetical protein